MPPQPFGRSRRDDPAHRDRMRGQLERILATPNLSRDVYEIASKSLKAWPSASTNARAIAVSEGLHAG